MSFESRIGIRTHLFADLRVLLARASPPRSGDALAGVAAASEEERLAARYCLADLPLTRLLDEPVIPYESDDVTRVFIEAQNFDASRSAAMAGS